MSTIATALERDTIVWQPGEGGRFELVHDDDALAWVDGDEVVLEGRRMVLEPTRGQLTLVDSGRGAKVAAMRLVGQGTGRVGAVTLARHRVRISKESVNPFQWHVTDDLGGLELLTGLMLFGRIRVKAGADFDPGMDAGLAAVALALTAMPELSAAVMADAA
ncbi:MAG TPA: hypothetical protein VJ978_14150 [Nitriliruptoraceae bacterium]|nr:hypothetical protein [Nitriliruptoraceae bacterium]